MQINEARQLLSDSGIKAKSIVTYSFSNDEGEIIQVTGVAVGVRAQYIGEDIVDVMIMVTSKNRELEGKEPYLKGLINSNIALLDYREIVDLNEEFNL